MIVPQNEQKKKEKRKKQKQKYKLLMCFEKHFYVVIVVA